MLKHRPETASTLAQRFLEPGDAVLEIGAANGAYTRRYADRVGPMGEVLAVEPDVRSAAALRALADACPWVTVCTSAVGAETGTALLYPDRRVWQTSSLYRNNVEHPNPPIRVPVTTVDELVQGMRQAPALIQIDAQGAEVEILRGAVRTLRLPIVWIVEVWPVGLARAGSSSEDVWRLFRTAGYTLESAHGAPVSWTAARRESLRVSCVAGGHCDMVMIPAGLRVEQSA